MMACSLEQLYAELGLFRKKQKKIESKQETETMPCHDVAALLETLLPGTLWRRNGRCSQGTEVYTERVDESVGADRRNTQAQTCPTDSESKISQTTFGSSITIQTDMMGAFRKNLYYPKFSYSISTSDEEPVIHSRRRKVKDAASNTEARRCRRNQKASSKKKFLTCVEDKSPTKVVNETLQLIERSINEENSESTHTNDDLSNNDRKRTKGKHFVDDHSISPPPVFHSSLIWCKSPFQVAERDKTGNELSGKQPSERESIASSMTGEVSVYLQRIKGTLRRKGNISRSKHNAADVSQPLSVNRSYGSEASYTRKSSSQIAMSMGLKGDIITSIDKCFKMASMPSAACSVRCTKSESSIMKEKMRGKKPINRLVNKALEEEDLAKAGKPMVFWAITKINVYPDSSRTYEVMPLTRKKPMDVPDKSESIFVLIPPKREN